MCWSEEPFKKTVQFIVFICNFIFWVASCGLLVVGVWAFMEKSRFSSINISHVYDLLFDASIILMVLSGVVFIVTFTGCVGALRENTCLLATFIGLLALLLLVQLAGGVVAFIFRGRLQEMTGSFLRDEGIVRYRDDPDFQNIFDWTQHKCCGIGYRSYREWSLNPYFNCSMSNPSSERCSVPFSCCRRPETFENGLPNMFCGYNVQTLEKFKAADQVYVVGCLPAVLTAARTNLDVVGSMIIGLAGFQMVAALVAVILRNEILKNL